MTFFDNIVPVPDDPLLGMNLIFKNDPNGKANLGVGSYKTSEGIPWVLPAIRKAERMVIDEKLDKEYLPISGHPRYIQKTHDLLFGNNSPAKERTCGIQTIGGSGALRLGGECLVQHGFTTIYLPMPTWLNHPTIFSRAGLICRDYPYYDEKIHAIDFKKWCEAIERMETGSAILLHGCCHNPTGMDPTHEQWKTISSIIKKKGILPFFDIAYQGFRHGLEEDIWPLRHFVSEGHTLIVASSYSKNMGLYNDRVGSLFAVLQNKTIAEGILSHFKRLVRGNYSNPPSHGAHIVVKVLDDPTLYKEWISELKVMRDRIDSMRTALATKLGAARPDLDFNFLYQQKGMFSFSGLNVDQVKRLREKFGVYMADNGRMSVAGLNERNIDYTVDAIVSVLS